MIVGDLVKQPLTDGCNLKTTDGDTREREEAKVPSKWHGSFLYTSSRARQKSSFNVKYSASWILNARKREKTSWTAS